MTPHRAGGTTTVSSRLRESTLRSNPQYRLVDLDALPPHEREALGGPVNDPDCHALLCPAPTMRDLGVKAVSRDVAMLYRMLRTPQSLPETIVAELGDSVDRIVAELVLDGILAVEVGGDFVSGPAALPFVYGATPLPRPSGVLARRSIEALRYGERLPLDDSRRLSSKLYQFGRVPITPRLRDAYADWATAVLDLGPDGGRRLASPTSRRWVLSSPEPTDGWLSWRSAQPPAALRAAGVVHKLYVSPARDAVTEVFRTVSGVLAESEAFQVKIGADVAGLCRPDKIVVYFCDREGLMAVARDLERALHGCAPHGVPFSVELGGEGLLSAGVDPPPDPHAPSWLAQQSWRLWVTNRLAVALLAGKAARPPTTPPWEFALTRLQLEGVDIQTWAPTRVGFERELRAL